MLGSILLAMTLTGTATSGGGGAFVERAASDGHVISSQLIDLWEAENIPFNWPHQIGVIEMPPASNSSPLELIHQSLNKLNQIDPAFSAQVDTDYQYLTQHFHVLPPSIEIQLPDDLKVAYFPKGAPPEGMMRYNGLTGMLDVNGEIFEHLKTSTDIAAAWLHEAIYKTLRESTYAHRDSILARHLNACLFSNSATCIEAKPAVAPTDRWVYECKGRFAKFRVYPLSARPPYYPSGYRLDFDRLGDAVFPFETYMDVQVLFQPDGSLLAEREGPLIGPLLLYNYGPGSVKVSLTLNRDGLFQQVELSKATSSLRGGFEVDPSKDIPTCTRVHQQGG